MALPLGLFLSIIIASATASTPPGFTPINTCCPPGSFLVIEDWQGSKQQPDGVWKYLPDSDPGYGDSGSDSESGSGTHGSGSGDSGSGSGTADTSNTAESGSGNLPQPTPKIAALKKFRSHQRGWRPSRDDWYNTLKWQYGRHNFINRVYCVPDKNNLPDIHNMPGSSYPRPPYWADAMAKALGRRTFEEYTWPLAENQTLWSQGRLSQNKGFFLFKTSIQVINYPHALEDRMSWPPLCLAMVCIYSRAGTTCSFILIIIRIRGVLGKKYGII